MNGQQFDEKALGANGGLYYLRARHYDPALGRFMSRDPRPGSLTDPQTQNAYAYALNNPVNRVDPRGLASESSPCNYGQLAAAILIGYLGLLLIGLPGAYLLATGQILAAVVLLEFVALTIELPALYLLIDSGCVGYEG